MYIQWLRINTAPGLVHYKTGHPSFLLILQKILFFYKNYDPLYLITHFTVFLSVLLHTTTLVYPGNKNCVRNFIIFKMKSLFLTDCVVLTFHLFCEILKF